MQAAYTWSKNLSTIFFSNTANVNLALCMKCQYRRVGFDRQQRFVVNYSYDLPFGKAMQGIGCRLASGWNVSGITIAQSRDPLTLIGGDEGPPVTITSLVAGYAYGSSSTQYVDGVSTIQYCSGRGPGNVKLPRSIQSNIIKNGGAYFDTKAFCAPPIVPFGDPTGAVGGSPATGFGNSGVGGVTGPGQFNWDISILKTTKITERVNMQFRSDFYNAFNHTQVADPGGLSFGNVGFVNVAAPPTAVIAHANVNPRLIQFGLRFIF